MTQTEKQIVESLKQGLSYMQIQESLHVSAKTIAAVKKTHFPSTRSNTTMPDRNPLVLGTKSLSNDKAREINDFAGKTNEINDIVPLKQHDPILNKDIIDEKEANLKPETSESRFLGDPGSDIARIIAESEELKLEVLQLKQEFNLMKKEMTSFINAESDKKIIIEKTKKIINFCKNRQYRFEEIDKLRIDVRDARKECETYCKKFNIDPFDSECFSVFYRLDINLSDLCLKFSPNENGKYKIHMGLLISDIKKRMTYQKI